MGEKKSLKLTVAISTIEHMFTLWQQFLGEQWNRNHVVAVLCIIAQIIYIDGSRRHGKRESANTQSPTNRRAPEVPREKTGRALRLVSRWDDP